MSPSVLSAFNLEIHDIVIIGVIMQSREYIQLYLSIITESIWFKSSSFVGTFVYTFLSFSQKKLCYILGSVYIINNIS